MDVRVWIAVLFVARLYHLDMAPTDIHSYRQGLTLGTAKCFLEVDWNIFQPRTILCDSRPGFEVMEFPVLNYAIFLLWKLFGEAYWVFRLLGIAIASMGLWHFYKIALRFMWSKGALAATVLFGASICFMYARKAMPDVFSLSLVLTGINIGWDYLEKGRWWRLPLFALLAGAGLLSKIPSAAPMVLLVVPFFDRRIAIDRKAWLAVFGSLAVAAMSAWYFVWIPWAEKAYEHAWFFRLPFRQAWYELWIKASRYTEDRFVPDALQSRGAYVFVVLGIFFAFYKKHYALLSSWVLYSAIFHLFMLQVGIVFCSHEYYVIPYVPMMALLGGYGLQSTLKHNGLFLAVLFVVMVEAIWWKRGDFFPGPPEQPYTKLRSIVNQVVPADAKVLAAGKSEPDPAMLYLCGRRGWSEQRRARDTSWLNGEAGVGLHYAIFYKTYLPADSLPYPVLYEDADFKVFKIKK